MAKTLYDYWFLQFDFPDENGRPYKSSGGKMVWNEVLKREIPISWEVRKISQIAKTGSGGTPKSTEKDYYEKTTFLIPPVLHRITHTKHFCPGGKAGINGRALQRCAHLPL